MLFLLLACSIILGDLDHCYKNYYLISPNTVVIFIVLSNISYENCLVLEYYYKVYLNIDLIVS